MRMREGCLSEKCGAIFALYPTYVGYFGYPQQSHRQKYPHGPSVNGGKRSIYQYKYLFFVLDVMKQNISLSYTKPIYYIQNGITFSEDLEELDISQKATMDIHWVPRYPDTWIPTRFKMRFTVFFLLNSLSRFLLGSILHSSLNKY